MEGNASGAMGGRQAELEAKAFDEKLNNCYIREISCHG